MNLYNSDYIQELCRQETEVFLNKNYLRNDRPLSCETIEDGIILPPLKKRRINRRKTNPDDALIGAGGVLDNSGNYVSLSSQPAFGAHMRVSGQYHIKSEEIIDSPDTIMYMNFYIHQWGHFLIDVINRLWYAITVDTRIKIAYTCYRGEEDYIKGNYLELIKLLGIDEKRLVMINEPTRFKQVIIPEWSLYPGKYYTLEFDRMIDIIVSNVPRLDYEYKNVYCSRRNMNSNKEQGEELIETIFNRNGYKSVYMETLSLTEQIQLLNSVDNIAMFNGSLAHNLLFARKRINAFIINKTYRLNVHQFLINQISSAIAVLIDAYCSPLKILYGYGPFLIKTTPEFLRFCKDYGIKYDSKINNDGVTWTEVFVYYCKWVWTYRKFILMHIPLRETDVTELEKNGNEIRKYFKKKYKCGF